MQIDGKAIDDNMLIAFLDKRLQQEDIQTKGFVLEDFPKTLKQAELLAARGIIPTNVIYMRTSIEETYKRTTGTVEDKFAANR